jgi:hypothetical protein
MKTAYKSLCGILGILLLAMPLTAQRGSRGNSGGRASSGAPRSSGAAPPTARSISTATTSGTGTTGAYSGRPLSSSYGSGSYVSPTGMSVRSLKETSFNSLSGYYSWNEFYWYLNTHYSLNPYYFNRFFRNTEPLITPPVLKLSLREPIQLTSQMLNLIDQLQLMLADAQDGKAVDKQMLVEHTKKIRTLAKDIRKNRAISYIDLRKEQKIYKKWDDDFDMLGPESLGKLREMALDLNNQLDNMYKKPSTQTVAVDHFKQPSFKSLAKGIEKLSKDIEKSIKKANLAG